MADEERKPEQPKRLPTSCPLMHAGGLPFRLCRTPDAGQFSAKFYLPVKTKNGLECLPSDCAIPEELLSPAGTPDFDSRLSAPRSPQDSLPKSVMFGRSRRMSKSLPELRDLQFVSVLPDVEEESSESSEAPHGDDVLQEKPAHRVPWHRKLDFVWCSTCQALGLANVWRFPYYCYSNGGGSFVLPYIIFMVICSIPFLCMELAIGQITQSGSISAIGQLCPLMKGIGVASMMLSFWLTAYYSVLTAWALFYIFNSFYSPPRWTRCTNTWNTELCREVIPFTVEHSEASASSNITESSVDNATDVPMFEWNPNVSYPSEEFFRIKLLDRSDSIGESGELRFELLAAVMFVWLLTYFALRKADSFRSSSLYLSVTVISYLLFLSLFLRTINLEGAKDGLMHLFQPQWDQMFSPKVLLYALSQALHSLGVVLGPSVLMGSCQKQHNNLLRDIVILAGTTLFTVLIVGCVSFATIGHLAKITGKPFWDALTDDPGSVYVVYSIVIGSMPVASCWGVLFFLLVLFYGLDSEIKLMSALSLAFKEAYTYYIKQRFQGHSMYLAVICGFCFFASIPYLTQAGIYFFQLTDYYIAVLATIFVAIFEICTIGWIYGIRNLSACIQQMTGKSPSYYYQFSWIILAPLAMIATLLYSAIIPGAGVIRRDYVYPQWATALGWGLLAVSICWILLLAFAALRKTPTDAPFMQRLQATLQPRTRSQAQTVWDAKPVIIMNGSTLAGSDYLDYGGPELLPPVRDAVQTYVDRHAIIRQHSETQL